MFANQSMRYFFRGENVIHFISQIHKSESNLILLLYLFPALEIFPFQPHCFSSFKRSPALVSPANTILHTSLTFSLIHLLPVCFYNPHQAELSFSCKHMYEKS